MFSAPYGMFGCNLNKEIVEKQEILTIMDWKLLACKILVAVGFSLSSVPVKSEIFKAGVAARVDDQVITRYDVLKEVASVNARSGGSFDMENEQEVAKLYHSIVERLVDEALIYQEFLAMEATVPSELVQERINEMIESRAGGSREAYEDMLRERGMSMTELEERIEKNLAVELMSNQFVRRNINVTPEAIREFYKENKSKFETPYRIRLEVIFFNATKNSDTEMKEKIELVNSGLKEGKTFSELARMYSEDEYSASRDGNLGWFNGGPSRADFAEAIKGLGEGQVSKPLEKTEGVYILRLAEVQQEKLVELDATVRKKIERLLRRQKEEQKYSEYIAKLRKKHFVRIYND